MSKLSIETKTIIECAKEIAQLRQLCRELAEALEALKEDNEVGRFVCRNQAQAIAMLTKYHSLFPSEGA